MTPRPTDARLRSLERLMAPRSIAVIGASNEPNRIGGRPISYMLDRKFVGDIFPVNPSRSVVQGLRSYPNVDALPAAPDVAIVAVPAASVLDTIEALGRRGTGAAIVFSSGFAEVGGAGAILQDQVVAAAARHGMRVLGPNTLGVFDLRRGYFGTFMSAFESGFPDAGSIGIASQSGAYCGHIVSVARRRRLGVSACATTGNEADVTIGDIIARMVEDEHTAVIAAYAEGIRHGDQLVSALEAARRARKPVVMMKVGRSRLGQSAAQSHTASIAGDDAVIDAVLAEFGVVRAETTEQVLDIAHLATRRIYPVRNTLGVITISGGAGVLISDAAEHLGLAMPQMPEAQQTRLKALVPFAATQNPVDCTAQILNQPELVGPFAEAVVEAGGYSSLLAFFTYTGGTPSMAEKLRVPLADVTRRYPDRLFALSVVADPDLVARYEASGLTVFEDPSRAVTAIAAMGRFGAAFAKTAPIAPRHGGDIVLPSSTPNEVDAKRLLASAGIACVPERLCATPDAAVQAAGAFGYPVVLKIVSPDILHKTEIGGVLLGIADDSAVRRGYATLVDRTREKAPAARIDGVLVARQLSGGVECILGIKHDPVFGPIAVFGLGGVFVEVLHDVVLRRCPFGEDVARDMILSIRSAPLLLGARGRPPVDVAALATMMSRLSMFAAAAGPRLVSIDLNPVFAMPEGQGAFAADAVIEIAG
jgi:acyl-CoA synthetase (NDP forming)